MANTAIPDMRPGSYEAWVGAQPMMRCERCMEWFVIYPTTDIWFQTETITIMGRKRESTFAVCSDCRDI